jgi:hypothetical protein
MADVKQIAPAPSPRELLERVERETCPACRLGRYHTEREWLNHPRAGTGLSKDTVRTGKT